jgi:hypothetical protein
MPLTAFDHTWRHELRAVEERGEIRHRVVVALGDPRAVRAEPAVRDLTVPTDHDTYATGYRAGINVAAAALQETLGNLPRPPAGPRGEPEEPGLG